MEDFKEKLLYLIQTDKEVQRAVINMLEDRGVI